MRIEDTKPNILVEIRTTNRPGLVVAYADVTWETALGVLEVFGFAIIVKNGKEPFVGFPSKEGRVPGKYFPVIKLEGQLHDIFVKAILEAYDKTS